MANLSRSLLLLQLRTNPKYCNFLCFLHILDPLHAFISTCSMDQIEWRHWAQVTTTVIDGSIMNKGSWSCVCMNVYVHVCWTCLTAFCMKPEQKFERKLVMNTLSCSLTQRTPPTNSHVMCTVRWISQTEWGEETHQSLTWDLHILVLNSICHGGCVRLRPHWGTWDRPCLLLYWNGAGSFAGAPPLKVSVSAHCL